MRLKQLWITVLSSSASLTTAHLTMSYPFMMWHPKDLADERMGPLTVLSDYPCSDSHNTHANGPVTPLTAGNVGLVKIEGRANGVHYGGSCQISLSEDGAKTFRTILSVIGGCPQHYESFQYKSSVEPGGLNDWQYTTDIDYMLPKYVKNGKHILAWTWFNALGNREFYMKCAWVDIKGGTGQGLASKPEDHPEIYVDRIAKNDQLGTANKCYWAGGEEAVFKNPGKNVVIGDSLKGSDLLHGPRLGKDQVPGSCATTIPKSSPGTTKPRPGMPIKPGAYVEPKKDDPPAIPGQKKPENPTRDSQKEYDPMGPEFVRPKPAVGVPLAPGVGGAGGVDAKAGGGGTATVAEQPAIPGNPSTNTVPPADGANPSPVASPVTAVQSPALEPNSGAQQAQSTPSPAGGAQVNTIPPAEQPANNSPPIVKDGVAPAPDIACTPAVARRSPGHPGEDGDHEDDCDCEEEEASNGGKPAEKPTDKPAEKAKENPAWAPAEKPEKAADKPANQSKEKPKEGDQGGGDKGGEKLPVTTVTVVVTKTAPAEPTGAEVQDKEKGKRSAVYFRA